MSENLGLIEVKQNQKLNEIEVYDNAIRIKAQNFLKYLHKQPDKKDVRVNKMAGSSRYLPISFLEMQLDELTFGLWETKNFTYMTIANEIVGSIELRYFHPTFKEWLTRTGAGAVPIQMKSKEKGGTGDVTDVKNKYINALVKDFPHLKAECFRNACISLGKSFGRDLNREFEDYYDPLIKPDEEKEINTAIKNVIAELDKYEGTDRDELKRQCAEKAAKQEFTVDFANEILRKIGL